MHISGMANKSTAKALKVAREAKVEQFVLT